MNNDDTITIDLGSVTPVEFSWNESDIGVGIIAQELNTAIPGIANISNNASNNASTITISNVAASGSYTISTPWEELEERLLRLEKIIAEEEEVRRTHPAVKMAYDEYRLLYILSKKNPGDSSTE
jgi:hypothetical protein